MGMVALACNIKPYKARPPLSTEVGCVWGVFPGWPWEILHLLYLHVLMQMIHLSAVFACKSTKMPKKSQFLKVQQLSFPHNGPSEPQNYAFFFICTTKKKRMGFEIFPTFREK